MLCKLPCFCAGIEMAHLVFGHNAKASSLREATEDIFDGVDSRVARKCCPQNTWASARRKLDQINRVRAVEELRVPPGNRLEALRGNREGQFSIRINDQFRICFRWEGEHAHDVEITDYH